MHLVVSVTYVYRGVQQHELHSIFTLCSQCRAQTWIVRAANSTCWETTAHLLALTTRPLTTTLTTSRPLSSDPADPLFGSCCLPLTSALRDGKPRLILMMLQHLGFRTTSGEPTRLESRGGFDAPSFVAFSDEGCALCHYSFLHFCTSLHSISDLLHY